jgi:hypothetical protein
MRSTGKNLQKAEIYWFCDECRLEHIEYCDYPETIKEEKMGVCGCGDYQPEFKFKGPGENWYVLQLYPGCSHCDTPAGVIIYNMSPEASKTWGVEETEEKIISEEGTAVTVIDPSIIKQHLAKYLKDTAEITADDFMDGHFRTVIHESFD